MNQPDKIPCIDMRGGLIASLIELPCKLVGIKEKETVTALFDSGASYSCIHRRLAERLGHLEPLSEPMSFETADQGGYITAEYVVVLEFFLEDSPRRFIDEFIVLDTLSENLIIGATTMQKWKIKLDFETETVVYDKKMHRLRI